MTGDADPGDPGYRRERDGFHPAMKRKYDPRAVDGVSRLNMTPKAAAEQERLRAQLADAAPVEQLSKTQVLVGGTAVTLDRVTGTLSCDIHRADDDCWHRRRLREVAVLRRVPR